jgi:hypothetical protein
VNRLDLGAKNVMEVNLFPNLEEYSKQQVHSHFLCIFLVLYADQSYHTFHTKTVLRVLEYQIAIKAKGSLEFCLH